ncbi:MAG: hydroxymethylglutaryl-CoA synthase family protein [Deltaproteobacteria bacterium]|uniref:Hydroxymethylglutaryl-CoA synthase family protein n=1 Tax=Candidatus Zymogenus saltonus TaxID=2844893 RepID=A0A9D8KB60_9DELT|nr:hydroxymethylglutaryl-CoA synthase family protein [Candidatus Zymogenus saltonus]
MVGITSYGGYIPRYRLNRGTVFGAMGWFNPVTIAVAQGEKSVANYDEDSITMAVAAGLDALNGIAREKIDGVYMASTTLPYKERSCAGIAASAMDLRDNIRFADFAEAVKSGTTASLAALDAVKAGEAENIMVLASDHRMGRMGSMVEQFYGDGAACLVMGNKDVIAEFKGSYSVSYDFVDHFRSDDAPFDRTWEERWIRDMGYSKIIPEALKGLLEKTKVKAEDIAKVVYPCYFGRDHAKLGTKLGIKPEAIHGNMHAETGDTGAAHPLVMMASALADAKPGDKIIMASFGSGSDALLFEVTDNIKKLKGIKGIKNCLANRADLAPYEKYAVFRKLIPMELGIRGEDQAFTAFSTLWRNRRAVMGLVGTKCKDCDTPQFPPQRICVNPDCGSIDQMEDYRFSDKEGTIFSYTGDMLSFSFDPPQIYGIVRFKGGGRLWTDFTDCKLEDVKVGQKVKLSFRRKYYDDKRGIHGYFWKAVPVTEN